MVFIIKVFQAGSVLCTKEFNYTSGSLAGLTLEPEGIVFACVRQT
jgi:hypothetical protein